MNIIRLYHTVKHLRFEQWYYRFYYKVKKAFYRYPQVPVKALEAASSFPKIQFPLRDDAALYKARGNTFSFLNKSHSFGNNIDWNYGAEGKLWTYNLNYFGWLNDEDIPLAERVATISDHCSKEDLLKDGAEPYPISVRGMNWIKFFSRHDIRESTFDECLYRQYDKLAAFPEYHLLANHLLENSFSLFFAAHYFNDNHFHQLSTRLLKSQLKEQTLADGGHYEQSPMYHCVLLAGLLDCILLAENSDRFNDPVLLQVMRHTTARMLGWLQAFCFRDGNYAMFGDSGPGIAPAPLWLKEYGKQLNIDEITTELKECGYRKYSTDNYEMIVDAGNISPAYQAGHAHADTFSFCLNVRGVPIITDTGISTYERNERRALERGTAAHNTITINGKDSSEVWAAFRTGKRAQVQVQEQNSSGIVMSHDGFGNEGITHKRSIKCDNLKITIVDELDGYKAQEAISYLHFHPDVRIVRDSEDQFTAGDIRIRISGAYSIGLHNYLYCKDYNLLAGAQCLQAHVGERAEVVIELISYAG